MRVFYCAFESIFDHVFDSQVLFFLRSLNARQEKRDSGIDIHLLVLSSLRDLLKKKFKERKREIIKFLNLKCLFFIKAPYFYTMPQLFKASLLINAVFCFFILIICFRAKRRENMLFHCRTEITAYVFNMLKKRYFRNSKVICDSRGVGSEEILYKPGLKDKKAISAKIREVELKVYRESDYIFCVSDKFKEYIMSLRKDNHDNIFVMPCCIDTERFQFNEALRKEVRAELSIENRFVVIYSGSLSGWQLGSEMMDIYKAIRSNIRSSIFMILSRDTSRVEELISDAALDKDDYLALSKPYAEVSKYLLAGDLALLIREKNLVNEVAFPVKFSEYIRCGIPVLSSITSDVKEIIKKYDLGFILEDHRDEKEIEKSAESINSRLKTITGTEYKKKISDLAGMKMTWGNYSGKVLDIYHDLLTYDSR